MILSELLVALVVALVLSLIIFGIGWGWSDQEDTWGGAVAWFFILLLERRWAWIGPG